MIEITVWQEIGLLLLSLLLAVLVFLSLRRWRHARALHRARQIAARLRGPATSLVEVDQQSAAVEDLVQLDDTAAAVEAARELLDALDAPVRSAAIEILRRTRAFDRWTRDLRRGSYQAKLRAVRALGQVGDDRALDELIAALGDDDPDIARAASEAICARDVDHAADRLADALASPRRRVAETAAATLVGLGEEAVEALVSQLSSLNPQARRLAAESLGAVASANVGDVLAHLLDSEPDPAVRVAAAEALARVDDKACQARLRRLAESDPDWFVRARAYALIAQANLPGAEAFLRRALTAVSAEAPPLNGEAEGLDVVLVGARRVRSAIVSGLRLLGLTEAEIAEAEQPLPEAACEVDGQSPPLAGIGQQLDLLHQLRERDPMRRADAARQLGESTAVPSAALCAALRDPDPLVRAEAARSLGRIGAQDSLEALAECLRDPDPNVRLVASNAMRAIVMQHAPQELRD